MAVPTGVSWVVMHPPNRTQQPRRAALGERFPPSSQPPNRPGTHKAQRNIKKTTSNPKKAHPPAIQCLGLPLFLTCLGSFGTWGHENSGVGSSLWMWDSDSAHAADSTCYESPTLPMATYGLSMPSTFPRYLHAPLWALGQETQHGVGPFEEAIPLQVDIKNWTFDNNDHDITTNPR